MQRNSVNYDELGEAPKIENYQSKPVQNYGLNLLKKMGFSEQRGIGFNQQNALNEPLVLKPRPKGLGLGAKPEGKVDEKLVFTKKDYVRIKSQPHEGMIGIVKKVKNEEQILTLELGISGTQVKVKFKDAQTISEYQYVQLKQKLTNQLKERDQQNNEKKKKRLKWILPNIRCRVIDKLSPYYLQKVVVSQLLNEREFECILISQTKEKKYLKLLSEKQLQTVIPKTDGMVLVLDKKFRGQKAKIIQRNKDKGQLVAQLMETFEVQKFKEDQVSEYVPF